MRRRLLLLGAVVSLGLCVAAVVVGVRSFGVAEMWNSRASAPWTVVRPDGVGEPWISQWWLFLNRGNLTVSRTVRPAAKIARPGRFSFPAVELGGLVSQDSVGPRWLRLLRQKQGYRPTRRGRALGMYGELGIQIDLRVLMFVFAGLHVAAVWGFRGSRRWKAGACAGCGYDLRGNASGVCPECGKVVQQGG